MATYDVISAPTDAMRDNGSGKGSKSTSSLKRTLKMKLSFGGLSSSAQRGQQAKTSTSPSAPDDSKRRPSSTSPDGPPHVLKGLGKFIPTSMTSLNILRKQQSEGERRRSSTASDPDRRQSSTTTNRAPTVSTDEAESAYAVIPHYGDGGGGGGGTRPENYAVDVLGYDDFALRDASSVTADGLVYDVDFPPPPLPSVSIADLSPKVTMISSSLSSSSTASSTSADTGVRSPTCRDDEVNTLPRQQPLSADQWLQSIEFSLFQTSSVSTERAFSLSPPPPLSPPYPAVAADAAITAFSRQSSSSVGYTGVSSWSLDDYVITNEDEAPALDQRLPMTSPTIGTDVAGFDRLGPPSTTCPPGPLWRRDSPVDLARVSACADDGVKLYRKLPVPPVSPFEAPSKPPKPPMVLMFWMQDWS